MYEAVKKIKQLRPLQKLLIKGKNGLTANPAEQSKIIADLKRLSIKINKPRTIIPWDPKNNIQNEAKKSPGCDEIPFELIKYAPDRMHEKSAKYITAWQKLGTYKKK